MNLMLKTSDLVVLTQRIPMLRGSVILTCWLIWENLNRIKSSDQAIQDFADAIRERLPNTKVSSGVIAVTVEFSDGLQVQVLPAFRYRDGYRIPDPNGERLDSN